mmetsp:Transcript_2929/g.6520  ORF Transcript_2929/g.6520 Transcript_2929/m.6520 type:complete len:104 (+) Transcript_2929:208-519(+)
MFVPIVVLTAPMVNENLQWLLADTCLPTVNFMLLQDEEITLVSALLQEYRAWSSPTRREIFPTRRNQEARYPMYGMVGISLLFRNGGILQDVSPRTLELGAKG